MKNNTVAALLDYLLSSLGLKNDAALSRALDVAPPVISKLRSGKLPLGPAIIISMHEVSEMPIADIKARAGLPVGLSSLVAG